MARASIPTLLALDRYAAIMGIVPPHFNQGASGTIFVEGGSCSDVWFQYDWQNFDAVSRESLAMVIATAERDIADAIGYWPAPTWIAQEAHKYPQHHRADLYGLGGQNVRQQHKSINTHYSKVIAPGRRAVSLIDTVTVAGLDLVYSNEDGDGFLETVTVTVNTTLSNPGEIKVYFAGYEGAPEWEIRPSRTRTLTGGVFTATFWKWQFIDPAYWEEIPVAGFGSVDLDTDVYVDSAEVYREYTDVTAASAVFYWEPQPVALGGCSACSGAGCTQCQLTTQNGCFHIRDAERGVVVPTPATYDDDDAQWERANFSVCRDPEQVKLYYYTGDISNLDLRGDNCEPLSNWWAETIAWLATARLERPFCNCGNSQALARHLMEDLALNAETSYSVPFELLDNPFGTRRGEIKAWQRVRRLARRATRGAAAI